MLINGIQLSSLGAQLYDRVLSSNEIETKNEWLDGDNQPTFIRQQDTFKDITLKFLITEQNEEDAFVVMSNLTMLLKKAVIIFDDMTLQFDVTMKGAATQERLKNGNFIYTVNLQSDYAKGQGEIYTTNTAATDSFKLTVVYYKDSNILVGTESVTINAASFVDKDTISLSDLGIDADKYQETHYNKGVVTNFNGKVLSYANLYSLGTMIINYAPTTYYKAVDYLLNSGNKGAYNLVESTSVAFTYFQYQKYTSIGQLVDLNRNRPTGYKATITPPDLPTFDELLAMNAAISVYFDVVENEKTKEVTVNYYKEGINNSEDLITSTTVVVKESDIVEGTTIEDVLNLNGQKPDSHYKDGYCKEVDVTTLLTFDTIASAYNVKYDKVAAPVYVEYYIGSYPDWLHTHTDTYNIKYDEAFDNAEDLFSAVGIDINKYHNDLYETGLVFNSSVYTDFDALTSMGVVQIYYVPKEYSLTVKYVQDADDGTPTKELGSKGYTITDLMFANHPALSQIININEYRPDGYAYNETDSYSGQISLESLTQASPILIVYKPVATVKTKSIVIKYKKELSSTYSTINTSVITIEEAAVGGGIKLSDLIEIDKYRPEYYNTGIIDGYSANSMLLFDEIQGAYDIYYLATSYSTQVRYYTDEVTTENWIGSDRITYTVLSFNADTTEISLGVNLNRFKPSYCSDGVVQYYGATTFSNLINLDAINIVYTSESEPEDPDGIDYPHRILYLQHNDMGSFDSSFPTWTLNHAYINTGVTCTDMSKLTVAMSTVRVFEDQPLYNVNVGDRYLFGAISPHGGYYIKYQNNTNYTANATNHNYFIAQCGKDTPLLQVEEDADNGFSRNTGIYASERAGYSYCTLKYSNLIQSNSGQMLIPLYLFACDYNGNYTGGIAGVGITSCKIYYDDVLIRDFIPVQYYDLIGTKIAPSNCLYDKVSQTFFEDATKLNSFNIMDDDEYTDTNPTHNIGKCYCNYYKDGVFFQTRIIYFRESDFINGNVWDPQIKLGIDNYQPQFYGTGTITNLDSLGGITFNNVKDFSFVVNYPSTGYYIDINYYRDSADAGNIIKSEKVYLTEKMFYSVPTFGQLVDLLKYKPEGYGLTSENYPYTDTKVTLQRLLNNAPYNIVYTAWDSPQTYTFKVKYYKHKNWIEPKVPLNQYQYLGETTVTIDETQIIDGIYPEDFMNFNLYKSVDENDYWYDGEPFEWYTKDENLLSPTDLREEYIVVYEPRKQFIDINYYTDEVDDANLIANTTWGIKINDWDFGYEFQVVDELPNSYFNKYKPANCDGGILQDSDKYYTFDSLVTQGHLDIVYMTREEPHDPDDDSFPSKILWYYADKGDLTTGNGMANTGSGKARNWALHNGGSYYYGGIGARIPYLDLGYTPKEIQRLRVQTKYSSMGGSMLLSDRGAYGPVTEDYLGIEGYLGPFSAKTLQKYEGDDHAKQKLYSSGVGQDEDKYTSLSPYSSGCFYLRGHCPTGNFGGSSRKATSNFWGGVTYVDNNNGMKWSNELQTRAIDSEVYHSCYNQAKAGFRFGNYVGYNEDLEPYVENNDHVFWVTNADHSGHIAKGFSNGASEIWRSDIREFVYPTDMDLNDDLSNTGVKVVDVLSNSDELTTEGWHDMNPSTFFHPYTVTLDAYNGFCEIYDATNSEDPYHWDIDTSGDYNLFTDRCKPKGSITLFVTRNPDTGEVNIAPASYSVRPWMQNYNSTIYGYSSSAGKDDNDNTGGSSGSTAAPGTSSGGGTSSSSQIEIYGGLLNMEYNGYTTQMDCPWSNGRADAFPVPMRTAIWSAKIWDRDKLVRDLIPVAKGDQIYGYTAPENGMFDKVTEIFFGNVNEGGDYGNVPITAEGTKKVVIQPEDVFTLRVNDDPTIYGKIVANYYDYDNTFIGNQYVEIPTDYFPDNIKFKDILRYNDMKPSLYYHDGMIDTDIDIEDDVPNRNKLKPIYDLGAINIYYKQKQYTKTVVYYNENSRIGSKDFFFSEQEIKEANTLEDLGINVDLYKTDEFKPGIVMSDETIIASDDVAAFINAPSPVVVYHKYTKEERPDLFYYEYYRGGAYEEEGKETICLNAENKNYLNCDLSATVLNPDGLIKYVDHYHDALYEDEEQEYFIAYQVDVDVNYCEVHKGPARAYNLLATITDRGRYTVVEENRGWGRLKEYPKGWILLKNTKAITGPGQNPDYDTPNEGNSSNVTIPFGTKLTINKMTIDRLWAYTPEYASWIKTEEISFDQSGRLYNALATGVIHLDQIDWSSITSLDDLNIFPEKFKLRFHEDCGYTYDGEYTQEAFSELHSVDFVYPEVIYPYAVRYYKDTIEDSNIVGTGAFSCSLSDWNPDWDTFLSTSWKEGWLGKTTAANTFHRVVGMTKDYTTAIGDKVYALNDSPSTYNGESCYYVIWKGYVGYIPEKGVSIDFTLKETINPTLYRSDVPIRLTWDFYDLDANKYKPSAAYNDGMFLWNPKTYDNKTLDFSFEEIITTGKQTVLYSPIMDIGYKAKFTESWMQFVTGASDFVLTPTTENSGAYDIEIKYQPGTYKEDYSYNTEYHEFYRQLFYTNEEALASYRNSGASYSWDKTVKGFYSKYNKKISFKGPYHHTSDISYIEGSEKDSYYNILNISNKRDSEQYVCQITGNDLTGWENSTPTFSSLDLWTSASGQDILDLNYLNVGDGCYYSDYYGSGDGAYYIAESFGSYNIVYYIKAWKNYYLEHYYVPLPKGYRLSDGRQLAQNGFYDLITQTVIQSPLPLKKTDKGSTYLTKKYPDIYKLHTVPEGSSYDYFTDWEYEAENVNYIVKTSAKTKAYQYPDTLSTVLTTIDINTVIPVKKMTADTAHSVKGTWYYTGKYWIQATSAPIYAYSDYTIGEYKKTVALKGDESNTAKSYYGYRKPEEDDANRTYFDTGGYIYFVYPSFDTGIKATGNTKVVLKCTIFEKDYSYKGAGEHHPILDLGYNVNVGTGYAFKEIVTHFGAYTPITRTTAGDVSLNIVAEIDSANQTSTITVNNITNTASLTGTQKGNILIGTITDRTTKDLSSKRTWGSYICMGIASCKIYQEGILVADYIPSYDVTNSRYVLRDTINNTFLVGTSTATGNPTYEQVRSISNSSTFTTEQLDSVFASANDFYWNGVMWIPASYTDDYIITFDSPKTYVVAASTLYKYSYPLIDDECKVSNLLSGDRVTAIATLGKDNNWLKLADGNWIFNNNTLTELEE